jgi:hypothetical protein
MTCLREAVLDLRRALEAHNPDFCWSLSRKPLGRVLLAIAAEYGVDIPEDEWVANARILPGTVERLTATVLERHGLT